MRFCYAVMEAVFYGQTVMYKEKPVLFLELFQAFHDYGCKFSQGDAEENADALMAPVGVELSEPATLAVDQLPRSITSTHAALMKHVKQNVPDRAPIHADLMKVIEGTAAKHAASIEQARMVDRKPFEKPTVEHGIAEGFWVLYWSKTHNRHLHSHVHRVNADGTLNLGVKKRVAPENVEKPVASKPEPKKRQPPQKKQRKSAPSATEAPAEAAGGGVGPVEAPTTPVDFTYEPPAGVVFAGAPVVSSEWDPEGGNWEVGLLRDGDVLTRLVSPGDWPYTLPPRAFCGKEAKAASQKEAEGGAAAGADDDGPAEHIDIEVPWSDSDATGDEDIDIEVPWSDSDATGDDGHDQILADAEENESDADSSADSDV